MLIVHIIKIDAFFFYKSSDSKGNKMKNSLHLIHSIHSFFFFLHNIIFCDDDDDDDDIYGAHIVTNNLHNNK